jgi:hypothetical protein
MTETRIEDVFNWDFPVMGLTTGLKVHRMDFTLVCVRYGSIQLSLLAFNFQTVSEEWPGSNIEKFNRLTVGNTVPRYKC